MDSSQKQRASWFTLPTTQSDESGWPCWVPQWLRSLARRLFNLGPGRHLIVVTISEEGVDWSVQSLGRVEKPPSP